MGNYRFFRNNILSIIISCMFLTGCLNPQSDVEKIYRVLEKVVLVEKDFENQQDLIVRLEKEEKELYNQIMMLGMKQHDEIVKLADEALLIVAKRHEHLDKEIESLKASQKEFLKIKEIKENLDEPAQKKLANELYDIMIKRYDAHDKLSKEYSEALKNDKKLYEMLKDKNTKFEDLEGQVTTLNATYKKVLEANEEFNSLTSQYNEKKLEFYKKSGLKVEKTK
nr:YkyA family protein [Neobacillus sp. Marseille-Q6967]